MWQRTSPLSDEVSQLRFLVQRSLLSEFRSNGYQTKGMETRMNIQRFAQKESKNWITAFVPVNPRTHVPRVVNRHLRLQRHSVTIWFRNEPVENLAFEVSCRETCDRKGFIATYRLI